MPAFARSRARLVPPLSPAELGPPPFANTFGEPCITRVQVGSPTLPIGIPSAKTLGDPLFSGAVCTQQHTGQRHGKRCGVFLCPSPLIGMPLANTDLNEPFLLGPEQCVASRSPFLATAGIYGYLLAEKTARIIT